MEIDPQRLFLLLVASFSVGLLGGVLKDIFRMLNLLFFGEGTEQIKVVRIRKILERLGGGALRISSKKTAFFSSCLIFLCDLLLFCYLGVASSVVNFYFNDGALRLYTIPTVAVGFLAYCLTIGRPAYSLLAVLGYATRFVVKKTVWVLSRPAFFVIRYSKKLLFKFFNALAKKKIMCYNKKVSKTFLKMARNGFLDQIYREHK